MICIILLIFPRSMSSISSLINFVGGTILTLLLLGLALLPLLYISSHESLHHQQWSDHLAFHSSRSSQIESILRSRLSNVYLRDGPTKLNWIDVEYTTSLADYISHQLSSRGKVVVRKNLEFKVPKGQATMQVPTVKTIKDTPLDRGLKDQVEAIIDLESQVLSRKHYVLVSYGPIDSKVREEITEIQKKNAGYSFTIVSPWAVEAKGIDDISNEGIKLKELPAEKEDDVIRPKSVKKVGKGKKGKGKKSKGGEQL